MVMTNLCHLETTLPCQEAPTGAALPTQPFRVLLGQLLQLITWESSALPGVRAPGASPGANLELFCSQFSQNPL